MHGTIPCPAMYAIEERVGTKNTCRSAVSVKFQIEVCPFDGGSMLAVYHLTRI